MIHFVIINIALSKDRPDKKSFLFNMEGQSCLLLMFSSVSLNCQNIFLTLLSLRAQQKTIPEKMTRLIRRRQVSPTPQQNQLLSDDSYSSSSVQSITGSSLSQFQIRRQFSLKSYSVRVIVRLIAQLLHWVYLPQAGRVSNHPSTILSQECYSRMCPTSTHFWQHQRPSASSQLKQTILQGTGLRLERVMLRVVCIIDDPRYSLEPVVNSRMSERVLFGSITVLSIVSYMNFCVSSLLAGGRRTATKNSKNI